MVVRLQPYNQDLIDELRRRFFEKYPSGHDDFDRRDIPRVKKYDKYLYNILIISNSDVDVALQKLEKILTWRKEMEINDLTWDSFNDEFKNIGAIYCRGRDKNNCRTLWFRSKYHRKGDAEKTRQSKLFIAFWLEKLQWEDFDNPIIILQDMTGAGVSNMDIDVVRFLIGCLELYFPALCDMLFIYEMPWILNAIWKIIEKLLSEKSKSHLRFLKFKDLNEYFDPDHLPAHMGGTDTYEWSYPPPEQFRDTQDDEEDEDDDEGDDDTEDITMHSVLDFDSSTQENPQEDQNRPGTSQGQTMGGDALKATENIPNDVTIKKVHFADGSHGGKENVDPEKSPVKAKMKKTPGARKNKTKEVHVGPLLTTRPGESLIFKPTGSKNNPKELKATFSLSNTTDSRVAYKIKTTSPDKYRVKPSSGQIYPGATINAEVIYLGGESDQVVRDKFLILSTEFGEESAKSTAQLMEFWRKVSRSTVVEHRLKCICETPPEALITNHDILKELHSLSKKVTRIEEERERSASRMKRKINFLLFLQIVLICFVAYL